jgi:hypothetical protein
MEQLFHPMEKDDKIKGSYLDSPNDVVDLLKRKDT